MHKLSANLFRPGLLAAAGLLAAVPASAQEIVRADDAAGSTLNFRIAPASPLSADSPLLSIVRDGSQDRQEIGNTVVEEALNYNLSVGITPLEGLNLHADAWRQQVEDAPAIGVVGGEWQGSTTTLLPDTGSGQELSLDNPLLGNQLRANGFDLGASYVWDTNRFGQFTLSTKTTYVEQFANNGTLMELANSELADLDDRVLNPELQSSLKLTWQLGNHSASAITNYFDSFKDISELDVEELNQLVDNITTIDLQYGYSVQTGSRDRAIISFGIRNLFDEKTAQILNSTTRILDQNGRVAYGSIKYQF